LRLFFEDRLRHTDGVAEVPSTRAVFDGHVELICHVFTSPGDDIILVYM